MTIQSHRQLRVWQRAIDLVRLTYALSARFPSDEAFGLRSQLRRAAVSIPSNIAEGHRRPHRKQFLQSLAVADGSLAEVETQLEIAWHVGYLSELEHTEAVAMAAEVGRMLTKMRASLGESWRKAPLATRHSPLADH